jgi:hypothetical protein
MSIECQRVEIQSLLQRKTSTGYKEREESVPPCAPVRQTTVSSEKRKRTGPVPVASETVLPFMFDPKIGVGGTTSLFLMDGTGKTTTRMDVFSARNVM